MYLKSIEVNGFKSFANKITFQFNKGITAIVGPNGSGKSNVGDAVRWVLGEQSALKLRGSKMEDVIFSGTELRKPQGSAYVAITLDNSDHSLPIDYNEVTVARRVYRSGESEYLINGNVTRLKDVANLFFDTGIGKEGYSIIGQGQVEKILSGKPDERRLLFDEAAGIVKYKKNKQSTEKALEAEHVNLNRVNDILSGLESRVGPLQKQSEKAKEFLVLKEELKTLDVNSFLLEMDKLKQKLDEHKEKLKITEDEAARLTAEFDFTKTEYDRLEAELEELNQKIEDVKIDIGTRKLENERADGEIRVIQERIQAAKNSAAELSRQIEHIDGEISRLAAEHSEILGKKNAVTEELKGKEKVFRKAKEEAEKAEERIAAVEAKIEGARGDIIDFMSGSGEIKEKVARYDTMLEDISLRRAYLKQKFLSDKSEEMAAEQEIRTTRESLDAVIEALTSNQRKFDQSETVLRQNAERGEKVRADLAKYNQSVISLRSRYESLRNLVERYDGYGISIRKVMEKKETMKGIVGVVADIISVDARYETAIETALGGSIQNIVTDNEETAKRLIDYLRQNKFGRATFLPITSVKGRGSVEPAVLKEKGVIGVASQLVETDERYRGVIDSLLGRSIVVDTIDNAIQLARKYHQSLRLVTPSGELISPGGSMTGGAFKNNSNLLGRKRELDDIEAEIGNVTRLFSEAKKADAEVKMQRDSLKEQRDQYSAEVHRLTIEKNTLTMSLTQLEQRLMVLKKSLESVNSENAELDQQVADIEKNKSELFDSGKQQELLISDKKDLIEKYEKELEEAREEKRKADELVANAVLDENTVRQGIDHIDSDLRRIEEDMMRQEGLRDELEERRRMQGTDLKELDNRIQEYKDSIKINLFKIDDFEKELEKLKKQKEDIRVTHKEFFAKRDALSSEISGLDKAAFTLKSAIARFEETRDTLGNYMWEEYELTYSDCVNLKSDDLNDASELRKEINSVKAKIRALGDVNVGAIEEYKEVSERYEFLKEQHDDIVKAEENLRNIIAELDKTMKETFASKFKDIQAMFHTVFRDLFGGGKASLELVDEENILESGIIINAQPPGKKLQNMMQLSGGEKSLTAISLLFAIQSLKPSPFCLLDEIEAALDDANVKHFANYLSKLTKGTQFIVITHRKGTMESADRLYGITMQEKGVSTLVSVNLIEDKLDK